MSQENTWICAKVAWGKELSVAQHALLDGVCDSYFPVYTEIKRPAGYIRRARVKAGKPANRHDRVPVMPGHLFMRTSDTAAIFQYRDVRDVVNKDCGIPHPQMVAFAKAVEEISLENHHEKFKKLEVMIGDMLQITGGLLAGPIGEVIQERGDDITIATDRGAITVHRDNLSQV